MSIGELEYRFLRKLYPRKPDAGEESQSVAAYHSRLRLLLGDAAVESLRGKLVVDFGCGEGNEAVDLAKSGVARVVGIDIREQVLRIARQRAVAAGVSELCEFTTRPEPGMADAIVSIDAFEHFSDPAGILDIMYGLLKPGGQVLISFGPPWLHPLGGHLFSVFPWAHLLLKEEALIRWRSDFKSDGATRFTEVDGGLNQMTIGRFEQLVHRNGFRLAKLETVPIRPLKFAHNRLTREFTTAVVRCVLEKTRAS